jgi:hypothetical protein
MPAFALYLQKSGIAEGTVGTIATVIGGLAGECCQPILTQAACNGCVLCHSVVAASAGSYAFTVFTEVAVEDVRIIGNNISCLRYVGNTSIQLQRQLAQLQGLHLLCMHGNTHSS